METDAHMHTQPWQLLNIGMKEIMFKSRTITTVYYLAQQ